MIPPVEFLWKQLNGPQVTGITKAIFSWLKTSLDNTLNYWNRFSIASATNNHLTTIGSLMGFARPIIIDRVSKNTVFEMATPGNQSYNPSPNGFSNGLLYGPASPTEITGGRFTDLNDETYPVRFVDEGVYRPLLQAAAESEGEIGSLVMLDDILYTLRTEFHTPTPLAGAYTFTWESDGIPGDIAVDIGVIGTWPNALSVEALLTAIFNGVYAPSPRIYLISRAS